MVQHDLHLKPRYILTREGIDRFRYQDRRQCHRETLGKRKRMLQILSKHFHLRQHHKYS